MNPREITELVLELKALRYFPTDDHAVLAVVRLCGQMCHNASEVQWLISRMTNGLYSEWPGLAEMRACFCSRFPPKDGLNAYSTVYLDGIPSLQANLPQIGASAAKSISGEIRSPRLGGEAVAVSIATQVQEAKDATWSGPATAAEIASAPEWLRRDWGFE